MKNTKKIAKKQKLTSVEKTKFSNQLIYYFLWVENNEDLVDPYVLDVNLKSVELPKRVAETLPNKNKKNFLHKLQNFSISKRYINIFKIVCVAWVLVTGLQLAYPRNRTLPLARLDSFGNIGFADKQKILSTFSNFDQRIVTVHTHSKNITTGYKDLGVTIDSIKTAEIMTDYPLYKRLIPLSIFSIRSYGTERSINESQLKIFVDDVVALASKKPIDAVVTINSGKFKISPSEEGQEYQLSSLKSAVLKSDLKSNSQIIFTPTVLYPNISSIDIASDVSKIQQRINNSLTINADGETLLIEPSVLSSWIEIVHNPEHKTVHIGFNKTKVAEHLKSFAESIDYAPIASVTTMLNNSNVGRNEGKVGKTLQFDNLVDLVAGTTSPATSSVEANVATVSPPEVIDRKYSKDSTGVQSLLDYWVSQNKGQYSIDFRTTNGRIEANINPNRVFSAVGVYRIYIASQIYSKISSKSISPGSDSGNGISFNECISRMIIESDESCTNSLGNIIGWGASDQFLINQGFESTTIAQGASLTTANDATDWATKLLSGNITMFSQANELSSLMSRQIYRQGIPAGSIGIRVANKSGTFGRMTNDVAIVYHPGGTYVLSVFSEGSNFAKIADLAREINKVMSQ